MIIAACVIILRKSLAQVQGEQACVYMTTVHCRYVLLSFMEWRLATVSIRARNVLVCQQAHGDLKTMFQLQLHH